MAYPMYPRVGLLCDGSLGWENPDFASGRLTTEHGAWRSVAEAAADYRFVPAQGVLYFVPPKAMIHLMQSI